MFVSSVLLSCHHLRPCPWKCKCFIMTIGKKNALFTCISLYIQITVIVAYVDWEHTFQFAQICTSQKEFFCWMDSTLWNFLGALHRQLQHHYDIYTLIAIYIFMIDNKIGVDLIVRGQISFRLYFIQSSELGAKSNFPVFWWSELSAQIRHIYMIFIHNYDNAWHL